MCLYLSCGCLVALICVVVDFYYLFLYCYTYPCWVFDIVVVCICEILSAVQGRCCPIFVGQIPSRGVTGCEHIPPFGNLQFLKKLDLCIMNGITHMGAEFHGYRGFPSLEELILNGMYNLEEWSESHGVDQLFPLLQSLVISGCYKLKSMPWLPKIKYLEISYYNGSLPSCVGRLTSLSVLKVLTGMASLPSGCIRNLSSLTELKITDCSQLQYLPGDEMQHLKMIRSLTIDKCDKLASFPLKVEHLSSLCFLQLTGCPSITLQPKILVEILNLLHNFQIEICRKNVNLSGQLQHLYTLKELFITGSHDMSTYYHHDDGCETPKLKFCCCDEIESLMTGEPASSVLEELYIYRISNLTTLPDWLQHLESLGFLSIENCSRLETVSRGLKNLHKLQTLRIIQCSQLKGRCKRETGEDWPIISHVPHLFL